MLNSSFRGTAPSRRPFLLALLALLVTGAPAASQLRVPVRNELVTMFFDGDAGWGRAYETRFDSTSVARMESLAAVGRFREFGKVMPPTEARFTTPEEQQRARTLMHWLWEHRCDLHSTNAHKP